MNEDSLRETCFKLHYGREILAGAIASRRGRGTNNAMLIENHLSTCRPCLATIGGEREIERVINVVASLGDQEQWQPDVRRALARVPARRLWLEDGAWAWQPRSA